MKQYFTIHKRILATVLVIAMVLSACSMLTFGAFAAGEPDKVANKTTGEIIAENYDDLTEAEKKLIMSGLLKGDKYTYTVPDADDELVSIDADNKTVTVKNYTKDGFTWTPATAVVKVGTETKEVLTITDGKANYTYSGDAFSVSVTYELKIDIDASLQETILTAPEILKDGVANLDAIEALSTKIDILETAFSRDEIKALNSDGGLVVATSLGNATFMFQDKKLQNTSGGETLAKYEEKAAAAALLAQMEANGGRLDVTVMLEEYEAAASKTQYLIENAADIKKVATDTYDYVSSLIGSDAVIATMTTLIKGLIGANLATDEMKSTYNLLTEFYNTLDAVKTGLEPLTLDENWAIIGTDFIAEGADYLVLDTFLPSLNAVECTGADQTIKNPLLVDTTEIQCNMSMYDVNVKVVLQNLDPAGAPQEYANKTVVVTLGENATKADILAAIAATGVEDKLLTEYSSIYVADKYESSATTLPETLTNDCDYTITYTPKKYTVTTDFAGTLNLYYGTLYLLPNATEEGMAYDYTVNGNYYEQGSVYKIEGDTTITRILGKEYTNTTYHKLVALNYFSVGSKGAAIVESGALAGDERVSFRYPTNEDGTLIKLDGNTLTANTRPSSYKGLEWMPYTYTVVNGSKSTTYNFNGVTEVEISETLFDRVDVIYALTFTNFDAQTTLDFANTPATLVTEAKAQLSVLNRLAGYYDDMGQVTKSVFEMLGSKIDDEVAEGNIDATAGASLKEAVNGMLNDCFGKKELILYTLIGEYKDLDDAGKLNYYYANSDEVLSTLNDLSTYLSAILDTEEEKDALAYLLDLFGAGQYTSKIDKLNANIASIKNDLKAPNAAIDLTSGEKAISALTTALLSAGTVETFADKKELVITSEVFSVNAENKVTISVTVSVANGTPVSIPAVTFDRGHILDETDVANIISGIDSAVASLNVTDGLYIANYDVDYFKALVGTNISDLTKTNYEFVWTPKDFTVIFPDSSTQTVNVNNLVITLPKGTAVVRYDYVIDGVTYNPGTYKFTEAQLLSLFDEGKYTIIRNEYDIEEENLVKFVNDLNAAIGNDAIVLALTKNADGKYAIVMKINAANTSELTGAVKGLATELAMNYSYIAFGNNALVKDTKVHLQALIDTIMESGFGSDTLIKVVDANGNINSMAMPGTVISAKPTAEAGGKLAQTTFVFGSSDETQSVPMYITLGSSPAAITSVRNLFANQLAPYFNFVCESGKINVELTLPQKAYEAYLAVLLLTDNVNFTNVNELNEDIALGFLKDVIDPIIFGDASVTTVENTLNKFGYNVDLTGYESAIETIRKYYKEVTFEYNDVTSAYGATANIAIDGLINRLNLGTLGDLIAEKDTGINLDLEISLANLDKDYEALYFDIGATGAMNKFGLTEDVAAKLDTMAGTSVVILLGNVDADLTFNTTTLLNLNGYTVNGDLKANGTLKVIDTAIEAGVYGNVTGTVSGNATLAGGCYDADVTEFIAEGYHQNANGVVTNNFFTIVKDANGDINVELDAGMLATNKLPDIRTLAIDIVAELLINGYTTNKLFINDEKVYEITVEDLVAIVTGSDRANAVLGKVMDMVDVKALNNLANTLIDDITDFKALSAAINADIENGTESPLLSYKLTTGAWGLKLTHVTEGDYLSVDVTTENVKDRALNIVITGKLDDKQDFADALNILADTTTLNLDLVAAASRVGKELTLNLDVIADVNVDFSTNHKYAVMIGVIVADGIGAGENAELVAGLKNFFETGDKDALETAFNNLTLEQYVTALKNLQRADSFAEMLTNLGLDGYDVASATELEQDIGAFVKIAAVLLRKTTIVGSASTLGSFYDTDAETYTIEKHNITRSVSTSFRGITLILNAEAVDLFASLKLMPETPAVNYDALNAAITEAEALLADELKYTEASAEALKAALADAKLALDSIDQAVVDTATENLVANIDALVEMYYTDLRDAIDYVVNYYDEDNYGVAGWARLEAALADAEAALNSRNQAVVDAATENIWNALYSLVDISYLKAAIEEASYYDSNPFTTDSWNRFANALEHAIEALDVDDQAAVDKAANDLFDAINALQPLPMYMALMQQIRIAKGIDLDLYTVESRGNLNKALYEAQAALLSEDQAVVDAATEALKEAIENLVPISELPVMDYSKLEEALDAAKDYLGLANKYTTESYIAFMKAYADAEDALDSKQQATIDNAAVALMDAIAGLVEKDIVDYSALEAQIAAAEKLNSADYTVDSWLKLQIALADAKSALRSNYQTVVDGATADLKAAIDALVKKADAAIDLDELKAQIAAAEKLNAADYTAESWAKVEAALAAAKVALELGSQTAADNAAADLKAAIEGLEKKSAPVAPAEDVNYAKLEAQIMAAEKLDAKDYTEETWAALVSALTAAKEARNSDDQSVVDAATQALKDAIAGLDEKGNALPIILIILAVVIIAGVVVAVVVMKKKKTSSAAPLVDYDPEDDN